MRSVCLPIAGLFVAILLVNSRTTCTAFPVVVRSGRPGIIGLRFYPAAILFSLRLRKSPVCYMNHIASMRCPLPESGNYLTGE